MQSRTLRLAWFVACLAIAIPALAQFGYPLKGAWSGEWWLKKGEENRVLLEFNWDGSTLTGVLNPGTENITLQKLSLEPPTGGVSNAMAPWLLHFEADGKDQTGRAVHYVVDGKLQNIGAYNKFVTGTWAAGTQKGEFKINLN
jgi:hypothetical protein